MLAESKVKGAGEGRTGAAVHKQSTLLKELSGHTVHTLALRPPWCPSGVTYSANSLTFSMATSVELNFVEGLSGGGVDECLD